MPRPGVARVYPRYVALVPLVGLIMMFGALTVGALAYWPVLAILARNGCTGLLISLVAVGAMIGPSLSFIRSVFRILTGRPD